MIDQPVLRKSARLGAGSILLIGYLLLGAGCPGGGGGGGSVQVTVKGTNCAASDLVITNVAATVRQDGTRVKILVGAQIFCGETPLQGAVLSFDYRSLAGTPKSGSLPPSDANGRISGEVDVTADFTDKSDVQGRSASVYTYDSNDQQIGVQTVTVQ